MRDIREKGFQKPKEIPRRIYTKYIPPRAISSLSRAPPSSSVICRRRILIGGELQMPGKSVIPPITGLVLYSEQLRDLPQGTWGGCIYT